MYLSMNNHLQYDYPPTPTQDHAESSTSNNTDDSTEESLDESKLFQHSRASLNPDRWSIFKVPCRLRQVNDKAYEPRLISIGPYHHGKEHLKMMEIIKESCLSSIIGENRVTVEALWRAMKVMEKDVRKCYPEAFDVKLAEFVNMMILDGCFIVYLFRKKSPIKRFFKLNRIFTDICCDLLLLENQLPFSVLSKLYGMIKSNEEEVEFAALAFRRLKDLMPGPVMFPKKFPKNIMHLVGLLRDCWIPHHTARRGKDTLSKFIRCATELEEAGIKIVKKDIDVAMDNNGEDEEGVASSLFDIEFTGNAKLKVPTINVDHSTELILRNFMAYEQFIPFRQPTYVCDYVVFMNNLIDSGKDVQLLRHSGVIVNWLGDDEAVAQMFNKLGDFTYSSRYPFYYKEIYDKVDMHCQKKWNRWKATLKKDYFNSPWSLISVVAAIVLLLLTMAQTIFSVLSYVNPQGSGPMLFLFLDSVLFSVLCWLWAGSFSAFMA
ncbi:hypothetical protein DITRI_Ditri20bG0068500 [Diplodiscus trichospermus]